jgi:transposase
VTSIGCSWRVCAAPGERCAPPKRAGDRVKTDSGNSYARRILVQSAWAYRHPAKVSAHLQRRLEHHAKELQDLSWKAQLRLCKRFRHLGARGKDVNEIVVAIARITPIGA